MRPDRIPISDENLQDMQHVGLPWCPHICESVSADLVRCHLAILCFAVGALSPQAWRVHRRVRQMRKRISHTEALR